MTLKQALEKFSDDTNGYEYNGLKQGLANLESDLEKLIEYAVKVSINDTYYSCNFFEQGCDDGYWQKNKSKFLGE